MSTLINLFDFLKKYYQVIFFFILIVMSVALFQTCSMLKTEKEQREFAEKQYIQNLNALRDDIEVTFDKKLKAYIYEKDNYLLDELKDLKKYNKELYTKLNKLEGNLIAAIDTKVSGDLGGIKAGNQLVIIDEKTNNYGLKFQSDYKDLGFEQKLEGISKFYVYPDELTKKWTLKPDTTLFTTNLTKINLTYGFREDENKYEVFAVSQSPKIQINDLNGVFVLNKVPSKTKKHEKFGFGPYIGFGLNTNMKAEQPRFGWNMGVSLHYDIWHWAWEK